MERRKKGQEIFYSVIDAKKSVLSFFTVKPDCYVVELASGGG
jgi:predicted methyltransferase